MKSVLQTEIHPEPAHSAGSVLTHSERRVELLAPAGDWECVRAAVENGADAIYFGLDKFNARMRARNFTEADLPELMRFLHLRGVKGYVTFNTLVFPDEIQEAKTYLRSIIAAGVDAAIVQDIGMCRLIRAISPDFVIHASTQMTITSAAGVEFARELGCGLVVLARECSLVDMERIQASLSRSVLTGAKAPAFPLEVFVHGALCVAYSGQCLTSESLGGRSANRGECAQACRMPYELISDGKVVPLGDRRYLLSPQDLSGLEVLPELIKRGIASLKIEGRLKSPEYVANITRVYRQALDKLRLTKDPAANEEPAPFYSDGDVYDMEMGFSRGLHSGWFRGINNQELVHARFGKKRGVLVGEVKQVDTQRGQIFISRKADIKPGDGVVFDAGRPDEKEEGGRVYGVRTQGVETILTFGRDDLELERIKAGDRVWKTSDPELERRVRQTFSGEVPRFQRPIHFEIHGDLGTPLIAIARDEEGHVARRVSSAMLDRALNQPLTSEKLKQQFGRLGGTPFSLGDLTNLMAEGLILPLSELNRIRRDLVAELNQLRSQPLRWVLNGSSEVPRMTSAAPISTDPELVVLVRNLPQLDAALECGGKTIYCEFEDPKKYRVGVEMAHSRSCTAEGVSVWAVPPRIFKESEEWILKQVRSSNADGYLIRNFDHARFFADCRKVGDFSLNVANGYTADYLMSKWGLERITASYDLNVAQLEGLLRSAPAAWFEITLHQHMPMFHMEHCVFCAFLSTGNDYKNCGRPCDTHSVQLRDRVGMEHPLKADAGCRNTVFNATAQTGAEYFERFLALGARKFRIEFLNETPEEVKQTLVQYRKLVRGETTGAQLWRTLRLVNQLGVTRGQLAGARSEPTRG